MAGSSWDVLTKQTWIQLQELPNIGPAMADDLLRLGVRSIDDLSRRDPNVLYDRLAEMDGVPHDPCVLDTFAAAIHCARTGESVPWWMFSRKRKAAETAPSVRSARLSRKQPLRQIGSAADSIPSRQ